MRGEAMVELKNVSFRYGGESVASTMENSLSGVDLRVRDGEFVLLTGPSGCGKTTILRLINGLIPHFYPGVIEGDILVDGKSVRDCELYENARRIGTVFQNPRSQFYNVDTTGELAFGCENRGMPEEAIYLRIDDTVSRFQIEKLMDQNIFRLSDGEKQKIACASIDVSGTDIILLDEPSANLDYESTLALRELILCWRRQGKTIIAAEHRIAWLWDLIDRAVILRDGTIIKQLRGAERDDLSADALRAMGLRSPAQEAPESITLPAVTCEDETMLLRDLRFSYPGAERVAVDIPEMQLAVGQITAITGSNGAGKTSFLNCLCGLEKRCRGILVYKGKRYDRKARQRLCFMVMQDTGNQLFTESVLDEVLISLPKNTAGEKEQAVALLRQLDLDAYLNRHPQSLSGGQRQRLAIACALASGREILLLDEPTSGLDHAHMMETAALLKQLQNLGTTILVVTHDSELIQACCGRMIRIASWRQDDSVNF